MSILTLKLLKETFAVHRLTNDSCLPKEMFDASLFFIAKTDDELSIVLPQTINIKSNKVEKDWQAFKVIGPLDFGLTGILAKISTVLAENDISIFAISTFDTDYILVKSKHISLASSALIANGYKLI